MKAAELRIGNWMMGNKPFRLAPNDIPLAYYTEKTTGEQRWKPIPLTEEWLVKLGFKLFNSDWYELQGVEFVSLDFRISTREVSIHVNDQDEMPLCIPTCKHVHQLQNLYFALTGEELTITE